MSSATSTPFSWSSLYAGKKVLITGHTGFKGSWLALWLHLLGARVTGYSLSPPTERNLFESISVGELIEDVRGDILDQQHMEAVFQKTQPEIVFHLAAQPLVRRSYAEPRLTYATNVMGTVNVLEAVRATPSIRVVVNITSDKCYENREWVWGYRENDPMGGSDPYSSSKGCAELVAQAYMRSFFSHPEAPALASARAGNVIGGGDWGEDRLLPDCVRFLEKGDSIPIRNPRATRPWQHVLEPLSGYLCLAARLWEDGHTSQGGWNFGPSEASSWSVLQVVEEILSLWGTGAYACDSAAHPHEAQQLRLDCSKANIQLGWHARWSVNQAIARTIEWYKREIAGDQPQALRDLCLQQIESYSTL